MCDEIEGAVELSVTDYDMIREGLREIRDAILQPPDRDQLAAMAMQGLAASGHSLSSDFMVRSAYEIADAVIHYREMG